ncbi:MAG: cbb3-type cytochrome oxidase assembly protein CcoS [Chitinophagaceae bacterium]
MDDSDYRLHALRGIFLLPKIIPMSVIIILLIASISIASLFLLAFLWSVKCGQFDDDDAPASRILFDDKLPNKTNV